MPWYKRASSKARLYGQVKKIDDRPDRRNQFQLIEQIDELRIRPNLSPAEIERRLYLRAERQQMQYALFVERLLFAAIYIGICWWLFTSDFVVTVFTGGGCLVVPVAVTLFFAVRSLRAGYRFWQNSSGTMLRREVRVRREVDRMKALLGLLDTDDADDLYSEKLKNEEKPKHDQSATAVYLTDDGELVSDSDPSESPAYIPATPLETHKSSHES